MNIAQVLGLSPKNKHVDAFIEKAVKLPLERDGKRAAKLVKDMSALYVWIEEKGDAGVRAYLGQFVSMSFSNLLIDAKNAGATGHLAHALLVSFLELTRTRGTFRHIDWLYEREKPSQVIGSKSVDHQVSSKDVSGLLALREAVMKGDFETIMTAIRNNPDLVFTTDPDTGETLLHTAAYSGYKNLITFLLEHHADINAKDNLGNTPLHRAALRWREDIVDLLLSNNADVDATNTFGCTPLHVATEWSSKDVVNTLLARLAHINVINNEGYTPLHIAALTNRKDIADLLLANKADINAKDHLGRTPLQPRVCESMSTLLRKHGGIAKATDTTFHDAARNGSVETLKSRMNDNPNVVFSKDDYGKTALHYAAEFGQKKIAELLLANKAEVDPTTNLGVTPLHMAASNGQKDIVRLLLLMGANVNEKSCPGQTALGYALARGHKDVVTLLRKQGASEYLQTSVG